MRRICIAAGLMSAMAWGRVVRAQSVLKPENVVIVANSMLKESRRLAMYYADRRGIPRTNICLLPLPTNEVISRKHYEQALRDPLAEFMQNRGFVSLDRPAPSAPRTRANPWSVSSFRPCAVVLVYGVPVRIEDTWWLPLRRLKDRRGRVSEKDTAAVESELALLFAGAHRIEGYVRNPAFRAIHPEDIFTARIMIVTRLDGPTPDSVRRLIDDSSDAEWMGLQGRAYFDAMGSRQGDYYIGDYWIREACSRFEREGYECVLDDEPRLFGTGYPMDSAAVYFGWYAPSVVGPMALDSFRFMPGAFAAHIHSSSSARLRTADEYWVGPLLARGACASWGAVSEPYLSAMPHLDVLADRLCRGWSFGESMYAALPVLSWQVAVVGDPLYRPFRFSLEEQIEHLEAKGDPRVQWAYVRRVNMWVREGRLSRALAYAKEKASEGPYWALLERLGDLYAANDMWPEAGTCYERILENAPSAQMAVRVGLRWFPALKKMGQNDRAARWNQTIHKRWAGHPSLGALEETTQL